MADPQRPQTGSLPPPPAPPARGTATPNAPNAGGRLTSRRSEWLRRPLGDDGHTVGQVVRLLLFSLVLLLVLGAAVTPWNTLRGVDLPAGTVANRTIKASRSLTYNSDILTQEKREEAYNDANNRVFVRDTGALSRQQQQLDAALRALGDIRARGGAEEDRIRLAQGTIDGLTADEARRLLNLDLARWMAVSAAAQQLLDRTMQENILPEQLSQVKENLLGRTDPLLPPDDRRLVVTLTRNYIRPNYLEDEAQTRQRREAAAARVQPVRVTILEGEVIVRDGEIVSAAQREKLERLQLLQPQADWRALLGTLGLVAILVILLTAALYQFNREVWRGSQLILLGLTIALPVVAARLTVASHPVWIYAFPIAAATMLTTVLLNLQLATVVAMMVSILLGLLGGPSGSLENMVIGFVASLVGAFIVWQADRIATFFWAGLAVGLAVFAVGTCFRIASGGLDLTGLVQITMLALLNGGLSAVLTFGSFSFLGGIFGITTHLQLLELAHPNQPLLYRLAREAPGTYHHSIVVSNLAESAVELVGGDPLFTRVAVLYHDIGKTLRPTFFIENQANRDNVHDVLDPLQSARIIIDHVTDGVRLAQKARLPDPIIDIIRQHHGTMLIRYFYNRALEQGEEVSEEDFRYPGPKPQTKEAGVIMLADSVEAAVRAAAQSGKLNFQDEPRHGLLGGGAPARDERPRGSKLQELVEQVIDDRVKSGQLDDCHLTLRDIDRIKRTFVQVLDGIYHPRIEYPTAPAQQPGEPVGTAT